MKRKILSSALFLAFAAAGFGQSIDSAVYVKQFPGTTVAQKVANAMRTCGTNASVKCYVVIDPSLAAWTAGTIPSMCSNCILLDWRAGMPSSVPLPILGSGSPTLSVTCSSTVNAKAFYQDTSTGNLYLCHQSILIWEWQEITPGATSVTPGTYGKANVTFDATGRATAASNGMPVAYVGGDYTLNPATDSMLAISDNSSLTITIPGYTANAGPFFISNRSSTTGAGALSFSGDGLNQNCPTSIPPGFGVDLFFFWLGSADNGWWYCSGALGDFYPTVSLGLNAKDEGGSYSLNVFTDAIVNFTGLGSSTLTLPTALGNGDNRGPFFIANRGGGTVTIDYSGDTNENCPTSLASMATMVVAVEGGAPTGAWTCY